MKKIDFKGVYLEKCTYWLIIAGVITFVSVFKFLNLDLESRFIWATVLVGIETYFVFYLNRYEPKVINFNNDQFEIVYRNKIFFSKPDKVYLKKDVKAVAQPNIIILSDNNELICKLRKKDLSNTGWSLITNYFV